MRTHPPSPQNLNTHKKRKALGDAMPSVQDAVARLCCAWWAAGADDRELLVAQALPYMLVRAVASGKPAHVKACDGLRGALSLFDFDDDSIADLKRMLLMAAMCPAFLHRPEGRRFLATLLTVHPSMVREVTAVMRNQVRRLVGVWFLGDTDVRREEMRLS